MPYIPAAERKVCDGLIDGLAVCIDGLARENGGEGAFAGLLNYACTRLALQVVRRRYGGMRYWLIAILSGIFTNLSQEFYRRLAVPYEDRQIAKNGDVDLYAEHLEEIEKMG
ncbi:MAG: DUF6899 family protein [Desulfobaccales bacterium]